MALRRSVRHARVNRARPDRAPQTEETSLRFAPSRPTVVLRALLLAPLLLAPLLLAGCDLPGFMSFPPQSRGNKVDPDQLAQLVPGTSSTKDAYALLGSPTAKAAFDDNTWLYIGEVTKPIIGGTQVVRDQQVVALTFDQGGVLRKVDRKGLDDSQPVDVVSRTTPSPGTEASLVQQLLGNVGRFSPGSTPASRGQASSTNPGNF
jgi:outer membrane protein assembly factor BamE (lipoprotein component of BamABCDE complex)